MATKTKQDSMTFAVEKKEKKYNGPYTPVFIPALESDGQMKVDQYEHVTLANEEGENCYQIKRGEWVDVPVPVYIILKERYPKI